jgi:hypothetical protein
MEISNVSGKGIKQFSLYFVLDYKLYHLLAVYPCFNSFFPYFTMVLMSQDKVKHPRHLFASQGYASLKASPEETDPARG